MYKPKKILVAPLNWGLGHVTRCIPIIDELERQGAEVILASDGAALELLKKEYPQRACYALPSYDIRYPFESMVMSMALQMPKILRGGIKEHFWLKDFLKKNKIDAVISDNRFGMFDKGVKSIFMTHQLNIQAPLQSLVNEINKYCIQKFDECWVPDFEGEPNLAGLLSHEGIASSLNMQYLGSLSRMRKFDAVKKYKAILVLSGPEPQRSILEQKIIEQLENIVTKNPKMPLHSFVLVRGVTQKGGKEIKSDKIEIHNYLTTRDLNVKILESEMMVARSGYSTVMDLVNLGTPAALIPTPGQTEQEYLATNLMQNSIFFSQTQSELNLEKIFLEIHKYAGFNNFALKNDTLQEKISELLNF